MAMIVTAGNNGMAAATPPQPPLSRTPLGLFAATFALLSILFMTAARQNSRRMAYASAALVFVVFVLGACNGGTRNNGTPPGTYMITITAAATAGGTSHPVTVNVVVH
jgi:hypothetical protein